MQLVEFLHPTSIAKTFAYCTIWTLDGKYLPMLKCGKNKDSENHHFSFIFYFFLFPKINFLGIQFSISTYLHGLLSGSFGMLYSFKSRINFGRHHGKFTRYLRSVRALWWHGLCAQKVQVFCIGFSLKNIFVSDFVFGRFKRFSALFVQSS